MGNLDGINKISREELKKSRKIILKLIGESEEEKETKEIKNSLLKRQRRQEEQALEIINAKEVKESKVKLLKTIKSLEHLPPRHNNKNNNVLAKVKLSKRNNKRDVDWQEKLKKEKIKKRLEKIKKEEKEKKKRMKIEEKILKEEKKKEKRQQRLRKIRHKIKHLKGRYYKLYLKIKNNFFKKILILSFIICIIFLIFYIFFVLAIIKFNIDNKTVRFIDQYFVVPIMFTDIGIVDYYDYVDIKKRNEGFSKEKIKNELLKDKILDNLAKKYHITNKDKNILSKEISKQIFFDRDINAVGINRINKIKELMEKDGNFVKIAVKYGDRQGKVDYKNGQEAAKRFGESIKYLRIGEVSDILIGNDGYYIVKRYTKKGVFAISYVFVKAKTLDEYINEELGKVKIWFSGL